MEEFIEKFKEQFKQSMRFIYPDGIPNNKHQWRDICKIYYMGALDQKMSIAREIQFVDLDLEYLLNLGEKLKDFNWWPDDSWKWW